MNKIAAIMIATLMLSACADTSKKDESSEPIIGKQENITVADSLMTPETLWAMGRVGSYQLSDDNQKIVYTVSYYSVPQNKSHTVIYIMNADGTDNTLLTNTAQNETAPCWIKKNSRIAFLSSESGSNQLWEMDIQGGNRKQLTSIEGGIDGFSFSPDESMLMYVAQIPYKTKNEVLYKDLPKATGIVVNDLMYKHWDEWVETIPHPYIATFTNDKLGEAIDILAGEPYECPMKPFGGMEQLA